MFISQIGQKQNTISFKSNEISNEQLYKMANTSDEAIKRNATLQEAIKFNTAPARKAEKTTTNAIPVFDTLLTAALTPGNFGDKVFSGVSRGVEWGVFNKITTNVSKNLNKNEKYRQFSQDHPVASSLTSNIAVCTLGILGYMAVKTGINKLFKSYKPLSSLKNSIYQDLNNNALGKRISTLANKNHKALAITAGVGLIGVFGLFINRLSDLSKMKKNTDNKVEQAKKVRLEASKELNNRLLQE